jgi:proteasome lid subunit RPN8/RPN11
VTEVVTELVLGPAVHGDLLKALDPGDPHERCGIIFGVRALGAVGLASGMGELRNVAKEPEHAFEFYPADQQAAWARVETWGMEVLGIWHTHPTGPEHPSTTDLANMQPWLVYAIISPDGLRVYRLAEQGETVSVPYEVRS